MEGKISLSSRAKVVFPLDEHPDIATIRAFFSAILKAIGKVEVSSVHSI